MAAVGAFLLAEAAVLPAFADAPVTFNVTVNVSSLMPDVTAVAVKCSLVGSPASAEGKAKIATGEKAKPP